MEVKACSSYVTVTAPGGPFNYDVPVSAAGSLTTVVSGSSYSSSSDLTNCVPTYSLWVSSTNLAYSGSFLSIDSSGNVKVDTNILDDQTVYVKVVAGLSGGYTYSTSTFRVKTNCKTTGYTITEGSYTQAQAVTHGSSASAYNLPTYSSSAPACYQTLIEISDTANTVNTPNNLNAPVLDSSVWKVKPTDNTNHARYTIYTKVTVLGGSYAYFGPYYLDVGCISTGGGAMTYSNNAAFSSASSVNVYVGASGTGFWTFPTPNYSPSWCAPT